MLLILFPSGEGGGAEKTASVIRHIDLVAPAVPVIQNKEKMSSVFSLGIAHGQDPVPVKRGGRNQKRYGLSGIDPAADLFIHDLRGR